jgi:hypothetical protein
MCKGKVIIVTQNDGTEKGEGEGGVGTYSSTHS